MMLVYAKCCGKIVVVNAKAPPRCVVCGEHVDTQWSEETYDVRPDGLA